MKAFSLLTVVLLSLCFAVGAAQAQRGRGGQPSYNGGNHGGPANSHQNNGWNPQPQRRDFGRDRSWGRPTISLSFGYQQPIQTYCQPAQTVSPTFAWVNGIWCLLTIQGWQPACNFGYAPPPTYGGGYPGWNCPSAR